MLTIEVTARDIHEATIARVVMLENYRPSLHCPIGQALIRTGHTWYDVGYFHTMVDHVSFNTGEPELCFMRDFDADQPVEPFTFTLVEGA